MGKSRTAKLTGQYLIRVCRPAFSAAHRLVPGVSDWMELRDHALKLRYWPHGKAGEKVVDLNWDWIRACGDRSIGELRIEDTIGGHDNLRVIFYKGKPSDKAPLPVIWILDVLQKKRQSFSTNEIRIFKARRMLVMEYFYSA